MQTLTHSYSTTRTVNHRRKTNYLFNELKNKKK